MLAMADVKTRSANINIDEEKRCWSDDGKTLNSYEQPISTVNKKY